MLAFDAPPPTPAALLADARATWRRQHALDYRYRISRSCFCAVRGPVTIRVRHGKAVGTPRYFRNVDSAGKLFRIVERGLAGDGTMRVHYGKTGLPHDITADPVPMAADDEFAYVIRRVRITRRTQS